MNTVKFYAQKLNKKAQGMIILAVIVALCVSYIPVTHALFEKSSQTAVNFQFGTATMSASQSISAGGLRNPGDEETVTITMSNTGTTPLRYRLTLERDAADSQLASLLMVYWDGEFIGMLSDLTTGQLGTFDEGGAVPLALPEGSDVLDNTRFYLTAGDTHTHTLKFEYHIGAKAINGGGRTAAFTVSAYAENIDLKNETVVTDSYQLDQVMLLAGYGVLPQHKVVLGNDITLDKNLTLTGINASAGALHIDLNGNRLNLSEYEIAVSGNGALVLEDSMKLNLLTGGNFRISGDSAYIAGDALDGYDGSFVVSSFAPNASTSAILIEDYIIPKIKENVKYGAPAGQASDFLGGYIKYAASNIRVVIPSYEQEYISLNADGTLQVDAAVNNGTMVVTIGDYEVRFEIVGEALESSVDVIESTYLSMLTATNPVIFYDMLLPQRFKEYNCTAVWYSSNPKVLDASGNYNSPWVDTPVTLMAVYTINDKTYTREYDVVVKGYSYEDKMSYFMAHFGAITYNLVPQDRNLWTASDYTDSQKCTRDLNITDITYAIPAEFQNFLQFPGENSNALRLYTASSEFESYINVTITFAQPPEWEGISDSSNQLTRQIPVFVKLDDYTTTEDIYKYVQSCIAEQLGDEQYISPTDFYRVLTASAEDYPTSIKLPSYYEVTNTVIAENGEPYTFTVAFHPIYYMIADAYKGGPGSDTDGDYDKAKTGTLEIEYVNEQEAIDAVTLSHTEGEIEGVTATTSGITGYELTISKNKMTTENMTLNLIASLGTPFEGEYNSNGQLVAATPQDRRNVEFSIPGALYAADFGSAPNNGADVYAVVDGAAQAAGLITAGRPYTFIRDLEHIRSLNFDCPLTDASLVPLKYFTGLENLDISAEPDDGGGIVNNAVTDDTVTIIGTLTGLRTLDMAYCNISDIWDLENCKFIETLNLRGNTDLKSISPIVNFAGNLRWLDTAGTDCDREKNEWAYAYCYFKYRDTSGGDKPEYTVKNGAGEENYDVPYALWQSPDAFNKYRKLVYANGKFKDIKQVSKSADYIWLPKIMTEAFTPAPVADYYSTSTWSEESANISVSTTASTSGDYAGNYAVLSSANAGQTGMIAHSLSDTASDVPYTYDVEEITTDPETGTTSAAIIEQQGTTTGAVASKRYFIFDIMDR